MSGPKPGTRRTEHKGHTSRLRIEIETPDPAIEECVLAEGGLC